MKKTVSEGFYEFVLNKYPALKTNVPYRELFLYICFSNYKCKETGFIRLPKSKIAMFCGKHAVEAKQHFNCEKFLLAFKADVLPDFLFLEAEKITEGWKETWLSRRVVDRGFDKEMCDALAIELKEDNKDRMFVSGKKWNDKVKAYIRSENNAEHKEIEKTLVMNETQRKIYNYMETITGMQFVNKIKDNYTLIYSMIELLDEEKQNIQKRILASVREDSVIHYYPAQRSARLYARGENVGGLKKTVRKKLCKGWYEADLRSSQFSILAAKLDAPLSKAMVMRDECIWESFHQMIFGEITKIPDDIKRIYKAVIYGIAFGKGEKTTQWNIANNEKLKREVEAKNVKRRAQGLCDITNVKYTEALDAMLYRYSMEHKVDFTKLLNHPIVVELLVARKKYQNQIVKDGGGYDVWNNFIAIDKSKNIAPHHIMAQVMQSFELEIISAVFDVVIEKGRKYNFTIPLFMHDGCNISFTNLSHKDYILKCIKEAVEAKAMKYGITTTIEGEML